MKPSNLVTPRSMDECHFQPSMDPVERVASGHSTGDAAVCVIGGIALIGLLLALAFKLI